MGRVGAPCTLHSCLQSEKVNCHEREPKALVGDLVELGGRETHRIHLKDYICCRSHQTANLAQRTAPLMRTCAPVQALD